MIIATLQFKGIDDYNFSVVFLLEIEVYLLKCYRKIEKLSGVKKFMLRVSYSFIFYRVNK